MPAPPVSRARDHSEHLDKSLAEGFFSSVTQEHTRKKSRVWAGVAPAVVSVGEGGLGWIGP